MKLKNTLYAAIGFAVVELGKRYARRKARRALPGHGQGRT